MRHSNKNLNSAVDFVTNAKVTSSCFFQQVDLPLVDGSYKWADGKSVGIYDSTIVAIHTDVGIVG